MSEDKMTTTDKTPPRRFGSLRSRFKGSGSEAAERAGWRRSLDLRRFAHRADSPGAESIGASSSRGTSLEPEAAPRPGNESTAKKEGEEDSDKAAPAAEESKSVLTLPEHNASLQLWNAAYDDLASSKKTMVDKYETILSEQLATDIMVAEVTAVTSANRFTPKTRFAMMQKVVGASLERFQRHEAVLGEVVTAGGFTKDLASFVGTFTAAYPPASMALSGIGAVIPFLLKPLQSHLDMTAGLRFVLETAPWFMSLVRLVFRESWSGGINDADFQAGTEAIKARVVSLYAAILEFQIKCVCYCYKENVVLGALNALIGRVNWKTELEVLQTRKQGVESDMRYYSHLLTDRSIRDISSSAKEMSGTLSQFMTYFQEDRADRKRAATEKRERYQSELTGRFMPKTDYKEQLKLNNKHIQGTCAWFRRQDKFRRWIDDEEGSVLLVSAYPGSGKSVLASHLINDVLPQEFPGATVCYYFFKDNLEEGRLSNAYSAILHGLFEKNGELADHCKQKIESAGEDVKEHPVSLWEIFTHAVAQADAGPVICVVDALDECNSKGGIVTFGDDLKTLYAQAELGVRARQKQPDVRFLLTTRGFPEIAENFKFSRASCIQLSGESSKEIEEIQGEIDLVVNHRLGALANKHEFTSEKRRELENCLKSQGAEQRTYLWVKLIFEVLEGVYPHDEAEWAALINRLPRTVSKAYEKLLERVQPHEKERVTALLNIVLAAYQPLTLKEVNIALNVRDGPGKLSVGELEKLGTEGFRKWMAHTCGYFLTEYGGKVHFIHQTARAFLLGLDEDQQKFVPIERTLTSLSSNQNGWSPSLELAAAHATLAESCISYLSLPAWREGLLLMGLQTHGRVASESKKYSLHSKQLTLLPELAKFTFSNYALLHWSSHFRHGQRFQKGKLTADIEKQYWSHYASLADEYMTDAYPPVLITARIENVATLWSDAPPEDKNVLDGLSYAYSSLRFRDEVGITEVSREGKELDNFLAVAGTAALWGHLRLLQYLVDRRIAVANARMWPMRLASYMFMGSSLTTQLSRLMQCASIGQSIPCLEYLISLGFSVNCKDAKGRTPLHWAAVQRSSEVASYLIEHGAEVDARDNEGLTPLATTLQLKYHELSGDTSLLGAAAMELHRKKGHSRATTIAELESVARVLVTGVPGRKASLTAKYADGDLALHLVARVNWSLGRRRQAEANKEQDDLIDFLVKQGAQVNPKNDVGETPLHVAATANLAHNVTCLLRNKADPEIVDADGYTPLLKCIISSIPRHKLAVMKCLLEGGANAQATAPNGDGGGDGDSAGIPALNVACMGQKADSQIIGLLLQHGADANAQGPSFPPPLVTLTFGGLYLNSRDYEASVVHLLEHGASVNVPVVPATLNDPDSPVALEGPPYISPNYNEVDWSHLRLTPLHVASHSHDAFVVRRLLDHGADLLARDGRGNTPLHLALGHHARRLDVAAHDQPWVEKTVVQLLWHGASAAARNEAGHAPFDPSTAKHADSLAWLRESLPALFSGDVTAFRREDLRYLGNRGVGEEPREERRPDDVDDDDDDDDFSSARSVVIADE